MNTNIYEKWNDILNAMKTEYEISDISFETWLEPLSIYSVKDNTITILCKIKCIWIILNVNTLSSLW